MKVLLIRPNAPNTLSFIKILDNEPLELEYLHTGLMQAGIEDYIYDGLVEKVTVKETILREKPDVVAITGYITQEILMHTYASISKKVNPNIITIVGGVHAQINYQRFYHRDIDYICRSESIRVFVDLVQLIDNERANAGTRQNKLKDINGLCYKSQNEPIEYVVNPLISMNINDLPIPDRQFFYEHKKEYRYLDLSEVATIKTSFSCPFSCNFCYCTQLNGGKYQERDLALVIEELKGIDCTNIQIVDDDFLVNTDRLKEFIRLVKEQDIHKTYICYARADFVAKNETIVKELSDIGFKYFLVGLEAVTDTELKGYNKGTTMDHNKECVRVISSTSAECIGLMIAPLDATKQYFEALYQWVVETKLNYVTVSIFTPIPGTALYEEYKDKITSTDITDWDFLHLVLEPTHLSRKEFYKGYYKLFMRLYRIAKKTGIYDFMDLEFYKNMLASYLNRKIQGI